MNRRQFFKHIAVGSALVSTSAGVGSAKGSRFESVSPIGEWETEEQGDATADVNGQNVTLRVFNCASAIARLPIDRPGTVDVSFDWTMYAEGYPEWMFFEVIDEGTVRYRAGTRGGHDYELDKGYRYPRYETKHGSIDISVETRGDVVLQFRAVESNYCSAGDHGETRFTIENLSYNENSPSTVQRTQSPTTTHSATSESSSTRTQTDSAAGQDGDRQASTETSPESETHATRGFFTNDSDGVPEFLNDPFALTAGGFALSVAGIVHQLFRGK